MRVGYLWIVSMFAFGCGSGSGSEEIDCGALDVDACAAESSCVVIEGTPVEVLNTVASDPSSEVCYAESGAPQPAGCRANGGECPPVDLYAAPPDADSSPWHFPHGCVPEGWEEAVYRSPC